MRTHIRSVLLASMLVVSVIAGAGAMSAAATFGPLAQAEDPMDDGDVPAQASVTFANQSVTDGTVTVESVALPEGGFLAIHEEPGVVAGASEYLEAGTHEDVEIEIQTELSGELDLGAVVHEDSNANEAFDFVEDPSTDQPMTNGDPVSDIAQLTVEANEEPTSPDNETDGEEPTSPDNETDGEEPTSPDNETDGEEPTSPDNETDGEEPTSPDNETDGEEPTSPDNETDGEEPTSPDNETDGEEPTSPDNETDGEEPTSPDNETDGEEPDAPDNETDGEEPDAPDETGDADMLSDEVNVVLNGSENGLQTYSVTVDLNNESNATIEGIEAGILSDSKLQIVDQSDQSITFRAADLGDAVGSFEDARALATLNLSETISGDQVSVTVNDLVADDGSDIDASAVSVELVSDLFTEPLPGSAADAPPMDLDSDGYYEDVDGDGETDFDDAITLAFVDYDALDEDQQAALDFNQDGELTFGDAIELAFQV